MKRWIAFMIALCLIMGCAAWAETGADAAANGGEAVAATDDPVVDEAADAAQALPELNALPEPDALPDPSEVAELSESTPQPATVETWFEEGFGLSLPEGWVSYAVDDAARARGIRYALGDGSGERYLYIQVEPTSLQTAEALSATVADSVVLDKTGERTFGGQDFVVFIDSEQNASCCATLRGGNLVLFTFTPRTDADFMLTAIAVMESFVTIG